MRRYNLGLVRFSPLVVVGALLASILSAQILTENLPDRDVGRPPRPPVISFLGIAAPGQFITDPSLTPAGPVAKTVYEEFRGRATPAGPAGEVITSLTATWDDADRIIDQISKGVGGEYDTVSRYIEGRLVSQETTYTGTRQLIPMAWNYWVYDPSGRLAEYRRGQGDQIQNHDINFQRDAQGRLTSYEYHQGPKDALSSTTEWNYSGDGKTVEIVHRDETGAIYRSMTQSMDSQGHVVSAVIRESDWRTKQMKAPWKVSFRYDDRGRLIEQNSEAHDLGESGREQELPPGKVFIVYDDVRNTKTTSYSGAEGSPAVTVTQNASGATIGFSGGTPGTALESVIDCTYDSHGNWTACRQTSNSPGVGGAVKIWRRTITYR